MLDLQGFAKTSDGRLLITGVAAGGSLPAGTVLFNGLARAPDGSLVVVFS
jgi:hypothetical protein